MEGFNRAAQVGLITLLLFAAVANANYPGGYNGGWNYYDYHRKQCCPKDDVCEVAEDSQTTGVFYECGAHEGYNFFSVLTGKNSYIIDDHGRVKQKWVEPDGLPTTHSEFTEQGTLLRTGRIPSQYFNDMFGTGVDVIREYNKKGQCIWEFRYSSSTFRLNQNFEVLPNGNVVATAWQLHSLSEAQDKGFTGAANSGPDGFWSYTMVEVPRDGHYNPDWVIDGADDDDVYNTCRYVSDHNDVTWFWDAFDHSSSVISQSMFDINKALTIDDIEYYPGRDHLMFTCSGCGEVFIIDHSIPLADVPTSGHFIYRWGNPSNYGKDGPQLLEAENVNWVQDRFGWHYAHFQDGSVTVFNNNDDDELSTIAKFTPPYKNKAYQKLADGTYGPEDLDWVFSEFDDLVLSEDSSKCNEETFSGFAIALSFVQELPNKNLLVTYHGERLVVEIADREHAVWKYRSPFYNDADRVHIDTPDGEVDICDEPPRCGFFFCNIVARMVRFSKDFKGILALQSDY